MKKGSALYGIGLSILFVILGVYLVFEKSVQADVSYPLFIKISGIACILFFGSVAFLGLLKFFKK